MKKINVYYYLLAIVVILVAVVLIARDAQPNSPFYIVRIGVIEEVLMLTKGGELAKANYALQLADIRLSELDKMKQENKLDEPSVVKARDNFNLQTIATQQHIMSLIQTEGGNSQNVLSLSEKLDVLIERAKVIFNIDQPEVLDEGAPIPKATTTKQKVK